MPEFELMSTDEIREIIVSAMEALIKKLQDEGFGPEINIGGVMHNGYNNVVLTDVYDMYAGNVNYNYQTYRLM